MIDKPYGEMKVGDCSVSRGRTVTETDIINFAMIMGMWLELQTNDEFAEHTMYGKRIAQGPLIYTIAVGLMNIDGEILVALSGVDRMRMLTRFSWEIRYGRRRRLPNCAIAKTITGLSWRGSKRSISATRSPWSAICACSVVRRV